MSSDQSAEHGTQPIGNLLDTLGITATIHPGELAAGAIVLLKVLQDDGDTRLSLAFSDGLGWIERIGMLRVAEHLESSTGFTADD